MSVSIPEKVIKWLIMKKDNELPWAIRILRWNLILGTVLFLLYEAAFVIYSIREWFPDLIP